MCSTSVNPFSWLILATQVSSGAAETSTVVPQERHTRWWWWLWASQRR